MTRNWDALALRALLDNNQELLELLDLRDRHSAGKLCPECSSTDIASSGGNFKCQDCELLWCADDIDAEELA